MAQLKVANEKIASLEDDIKKHKDFESQQLKRIRELEAELEKAVQREQILEERMRQCEDKSFKIKFERMQEKCDMYVRHCKQLRDQVGELEKRVPSKQDKAKK